MSRFNETKCFHGTLAFDKGGYEIVCLNCHVKWVAVDGEYEPDLEREENGLGLKDLRVAPRLAYDPTN